MLRKNSNAQAVVRTVAADEEKIREKIIKAKKKENNRQNGQEKEQGKRQINSKLQIL